MGGVDRRPRRRSAAPRIGAACPPPWFPPSLSPQHRHTKNHTHAHARARAHTPKHKRASTHARTHARTHAQTHAFALISISPRPRLPAIARALAQCTVCARAWGAGWCACARASTRSEDARMTYRAGAWAGSAE